jgi:hypothetical protein
MIDNSNPQGTGTDTTQITDDGMEAFLADSETSGQEQDQQPSESDQDPDDQGQEGDDEQEVEKFVILADGTKMSAQDFENQYVPKSVVTRQQQQDSVVRKEVEAKQARLAEQASMIDAQYKQLEQSNAVTEDFLTSQLPEEPDLRLLAQNPGEYMQQKAYYDHHMGNLQRFAQARYQQRQAYEGQVQENQSRFMEMENQKLEQAFPHIAGNPEKASAFHKANREVAKAYGFSEQDYDTANSGAKRLLARLSYLEAKEKARTATPAQQQQQRKPGAQVQGKSAVNPVASKSVQAFRQSGNADSARRALDSGAFDHLL